MKQYLFIIILSTFIIGCKEKTTQPTSDVETREVYGVLIKDASISNRTITLTVDCEVPDPSWEYSHFDTTPTEKRIDLKIYTKQKPNATAAAVLWSFVTTINIQVPAAGSYTIHYKANYTSYKDSTFEIN